MIQIKLEGNFARVSGAPCHVAMFFSFWQGHVWKDWSSAKEINDTSSHFHKNAKQVVTSAHEGRPVLLANTGDFEEAVKVASETCKSLGIEVEHV